MIQSKFLYVKLPSRVFITQWDYWGIFSVWTPTIAAGFCCAPDTKKHLKQPLYAVDINVDCITVGRLSLIFAGHYAWTSAKKLFPSDYGLHYILFTTIWSILLQKLPIFITSSAAIFRYFAILCSFYRLRRCVENDTWKPFCLFIKHLYVPLSRVPLCSRVTIWVQLTGRQISFKWLIDTHHPLDKIAAISQTTFSSAFSWMKMLEFRFNFHGNSFRRV